MKNIYKYTLPVKDESVLEIPCEKILSVESQHGNIVVYAIVEIIKPVIARRFEFLVRGTGHGISEDIDSYEFLGTVKMAGDNFMFHVFYKEIF